MIGDARLRELAKIGAEYRHWTVGDDYIIYGHGHDEVAPHECSHPDCVLVRAGTPAPASVQRCQLCKRSQPCPQHGRTPVTDADWDEFHRMIADELAPAPADTPAPNDREDPEIAAITRRVMQEINDCTPGTRLAEVPTLFAFGPIYNAIRAERLRAVSAVPPAAPQEPGT